MNPLTRTQLKEIFKKAKKLRIPENLEEIVFEELTYYAWLDQTDNTIFMVYEYDGKPTGIKWNATKFSKSSNSKAFCEICTKHRDRTEITLVSSKTRKLPKHVDYRSRGNYICLNFEQCNRDMKSDEKLKKLYDSILKDD